MCEVEGIGDLLRRFKKVCCAELCIFVAICTLVLALLCVDDAY